MATETKQKNTASVIPEELRHSIRKIAHAMLKELWTDSEDEQYPEDHLVHDCNRVLSWCKAVEAENAPVHRAPTRGWTNRPTELVALWLHNDQRSYRFWLNDANGVVLLLCTADDPDTKRRQAVGHLAERLREGHAVGRGLTRPLVADLVGASLAEVNWREVAESILEDVRV
jgi:hypothetical protein